MGQEAAEGFGKGLLDADRQHRLESLDGWTWDPNADKWEERFNRLLEYVEGNGHARVPASYTVDGYPLGKWVAVQRNFHPAGTLDVRPRDADSRSCPVGHGMRVTLRGRRVLANCWTTSKRNDDALVPIAHKTDDGYPLGQWVATQRHFRAKGTLGSDREQRLGELAGWTWNGRDAIWEEGFRRLLDYVERNGDALVPKRYKDEDGNQLGVWVMRQRKSYAAGTLDSDRERRLREEVPGWTWRAR